MRPPFRSGKDSRSLRPVRRRLSRADGTALASGLLLAVLTLSFFAWSIDERIRSDRSLGPVAPSTPTPPAPPAPRSRFAAGQAR